MPEDEFNEFLDEQIESLRPFYHRIPELDLKMVRTAAWRNRLRRNAAAQLVTSPLHQMKSTLAKMGLAIAVLRKPNKSFVIGSHPMIRCAPPGGGALGAPGVEVWLPVARDVAISPLNEEGTVRVLDNLADHDVRRLNSAIFNQSREIAGCSHKLVASIAGVKV